MEDQNQIDQPNQEGVNAQEGHGGGENIENTFSVNSVPSSQFSEYDRLVMCPIFKIYGQGHRFIRVAIEHEGDHYDKENFIKFVNEHEGKDPNGNEVSQVYGCPVDSTKLIPSP